MNKTNEAPESLLDFLDETAGAQQQSGSDLVKGALVSHQVPATIDAQLAVALPKAYAKENVGSKVVDLVSSREFLQRFSDELGTPGVDESKADFVNRGKELLRKLLRAALGR